MLLLMGCAGRACAQVSATASSNATIVAPISMTKNVDMNFGTAAVSTGTGGRVILAPAGTRTTAGGGGVTLPSSTGTVTAASFTVAGAPGYTYSISLPSSAVITGPGAATMTVNSFTSIPSATGTLSAGGTQSLNVGATLNISPAQVAGTYTNATAVPVTVNYN
jgi:hypothetical protein